MLPFVLIKHAWITFQISGILMHQCAKAPEHQRQMQLRPHNCYD